MKEEKPLKPIKDTLYPRVIDRAKTTKVIIDKRTLKRANSVKRMRDILKAQNDIDNKNIIEATERFYQNKRIKGYTPPKKFNYWKIPLIIGLFGLVCLGYVLVIMIIDLWN